MEDELMKETIDSAIEETPMVSINCESTGETKSLKHTPHESTVERVRECVHLYKRGWKKAQIADAYRVSLKSVYNWLKIAEELGIEDVPPDEV